MIFKEKKLLKLSFFFLLMIKLKIEIFINYMKLEKRILSQSTLSSIK